MVPNKSYVPFALISILALTISLRASAAPSRAESGEDDHNIQVGQSNLVEDSFHDLDDERKDHELPSRRQGEREIPANKDVDENDEGNSVRVQKVENSHSEHINDDYKQKNSADLLKTAEPEPDRPDNSGSRRESRRRLKTYDGPEEATSGSVPSLNILEFDERSSERDENDINDEEEEDEDQEAPAAVHGQEISSEKLSDKPINTNKHEQKHSNDDNDEAREEAEPRPKGQETLDKVHQIGDSVKEQSGLQAREPEYVAEDQPENNSQDEHHRVLHDDKEQDENAYETPIHRDQVEPKFESKKEPEDSSFEENSRFLQNEADSNDTPVHRDDIEPKYEAKEESKHSSNYEPKIFSHNIETQIDDEKGPIDYEGAPIRSLQERVEPEFDVKKEHSSLEETSRLSQDEDVNATPIHRDQVEPKFDAKKEPEDSSFEENPRFSQNEADSNDTPVHRDDIEPKFEAKEESKHSSNYEPSRFLQDVEEQIDDDENVPIHSLQDRVGPNFAAKNDDEEKEEAKLPDRASHNEHDTSSQGQDVLTEAKHREHQQAADDVDKDSGDDEKVQEREQFNDAISEKSGDYVNDSDKKPEQEHSDAGKPVENWKDDLGGLKNDYQYDEKPQEVEDEQRKFNNHHPNEAHFIPEPQKAVQSLVDHRETKADNEPEKHEESENASKNSFESGDFKDVKEVEEDVTKVKEVEKDVVPPVPNQTLSDLLKIDKVETKKNSFNKPEKQVQPLSSGPRDAEQADERHFKPAGNENSYQNHPLAQPENARPSNVEVAAPAKQNPKRHIREMKQKAKSFFSSLTPRWRRKNKN